MCHSDTRERHTPPSCKNNKQFGLLPLLESGDGRVSDVISQSMLSDEVSREKGDRARTGDDSGPCGSILTVGEQRPRLRARLEHEVGGKGAAGAANFSVIKIKI